MAVYANADKLEDGARRRAVWEGEIAEDADAGDAAERGTFCDWDRLRSLTPLDADVRRSARFRPHATYPGFDLAPPRRGDE